MADLENIPGSLLRTPPGKPEYEELTRASSTYKPLQTFRLAKEKSYQQQFADMYFLRLTKIKPAVDEVALSAWDGTIVAGEPVKRVERVLDIRQGELCWVTGTVYMEMPLKPSILEDVSKDRWISAPITQEKYWSEEDAVTLEDESGRIRLVGDVLKSHLLVTGCIISVMGSENVNGELEVVDFKLPDLAPQPERWALSDLPSGSDHKGRAKKPKDEDEEMADAATRVSGGKIAIVSGLAFSGSDASHSLELTLLLEYLLGEALDPSTQQELSQISRLIIAGNSISLEERKVPLDEAEAKKPINKKYGYDASSYNAQPSQLFDQFLAALLPTMPVTLLPGAKDPATASYPQQPIHAAMFPESRPYAAPPTSSDEGWLDTVTNPWDGEIEGWRVLGTGGQNIDDIFKYVDSEDRLGMMEATCRWRCMAPTAPDTLWSYPFQDDDPFVMKECPHLYFVGCQPKFGTRLIRGREGQKVRLVAVPSFTATQEIVLLDSETLEVSRVKLRVS